MPVYEYACTECGERLEVRQSFTDDPLTECPACSGRLRKVLSPVGVVFKGSGFYRTDSRKSDSSGDKKPADGGSAKESASSGADSSGGSSTSPSSGSGTSSSGSETKSGATAPKAKAATAG